MDRITRARTYLIWSIVIVTVVFLAVISPWKGLGFITFFVLTTGVVLWIAGAVLLIAGLANLKKESFRKIDLVVALVCFLLFVPIGFQYMKTSGEIRTRITVRIENQSDVVLQHVNVYGSGDLFAGRDTLKMDRLDKGQLIKFVIQPDIKPQKGGGKMGSIMMAYDFDTSRISKVIAGEFSIYPQNIQQEVVVVVNKAFLEQR